jgi:hypothetical protein
LSGAGFSDKREKSYFLPSPIAHSFGITKTQNS